MSSLAIAGPTILGSRWVPPPPGIIASLVSVKPTLKIYDFIENTKIKF